MKASEMTNDELASWIESTISDSGYPSSGDDYLREVAERLRLLDNVTMALNIEVGMNKVAAEMTAPMRAALAEAAGETTLN